MKRLKNISGSLAKNWAPKVISLAIALFLFLFYRISTLETRTFSVPVKIENAGSLTPSMPYLKTVRISLRGERDKIYSIAEDDISPYLDMASALEEGEAAFPVRLLLSGAAAVADPLDITVDPPEITLMLEKKATKTLPVSCVLTDFPAEGYIFESCELNPSSIEVSGPKSLIGSISEIKTEPISLSGLTALTDGTVNVVLPGDLFCFEDISSVSYRLLISPKDSERRVGRSQGRAAPPSYGLEAASAHAAGRLAARGAGMGFRGRRAP